MRKIRTLLTPRKRQSRLIEQNIGIAHSDESDVCNSEVGKLLDRPETTETTQTSTIREKVHLPNESPSSLQKDSKEKVTAIMSPLFGIPAIALFPWISLIVVISAFDSMPFGLSPLWLLPLIW